MYQPREMTASVGLLIGVGTQKATEPWDVIPSKDGEPFAVKTALGWVINGPIDLPSMCKGSFTLNYIQTVISIRTEIE